MVVKAMWQSNTSTLPSRRYQKRRRGLHRAGDPGHLPRAVPGPRRLDRAGGRLERPEEGALDRQLDADHVAAHGDLLQLPVNVGKELGQKDDQTAQLRTR